MFSVDVDEADVAVLSQNLAKSKDLFRNIASSLQNISSKTLTASRNIRPVLTEFNTLTSKKTRVEEGLQLLQDVSEYSSRAADAQRILNGPIENAGTQKYLNTLEESKQLLRKMKTDIREFDGVVVSFGNAVDLAEMAVVTHFSKMVSNVDIQNGTLPRYSDALAALSYFANQGNLRAGHEAMEKVFSRQLTKQLAPLEAACTLKKRQSNIPYEKGSLGLLAYTEEFLRCVDSFSKVCDQLQILGSPVFKNSIASYLDTRLTPILAGYNTSIDLTGLANQDIAVLDILDSLTVLDARLKPYKCGFESTRNVQREYMKLVEKAQGLLTVWVKYIDQRVSLLERYNEHSIPEVVVEVISKVRKVAEFQSLPTLFEDQKLGSWLSVKPPLRFVTVYTSVVPGAESTAQDPQAFLVSSYFLDLIDELMVNVEINLKEQSGDNIRKLTQGFMLVKNVVMIETIINRLEKLYQKLGLIGMERLQRLKNRFLKLFLDDWNYASYIIIRDMTQITTTNAMHGGQNSAKEKEQIKELFKNFNESFEEALRHYEKFNIQEKDLRVYLSSEIKKLIINAYNKLYDKYGSGEFTKNRSKYIRYDKLQFERLLNEKL